MKTLGIETSCDETAVAMVENDKILSSRTYTQLVHSRFGGVVPELASRDHIKNLCKITADILKKSGNPDCIAVTAGPGLPGSLLVGVMFAKGMAMRLSLPIIPVNHLEAHIFAVKLSSSMSPPFIALVVSGGHTEVVLVEEWGKYQQLGSTRDDAAGEAFDKVAKLLGLPYPGGPQIQRLAQGGNPSAFNFPRAMLDSEDLDFSFSGLKTAVAYLVSKMSAGELDARKSNIAASFQEAVVDILVGKLVRASLATGVKKIAVVGGVATNQRLREKLALQKWELCLPPPELCTDNGATVASCGEFYFEKGVSAELDFPIKPRWAL